MKKSEMKRLLLEMLEGILAGTDFRLKKRDDAFVRKIPSGSQAIGLPLWDYNPVFEFSLNICIRLDAVEEIFHRYSGADPKYRFMSHTTMTIMDYFLGSPSLFKVSTAEDVASIGAILATPIREKVVPFLDQLSSIEALDRAVNGVAPQIDITMNPWRAVHAVILAHLAGNDDLERIIAWRRAEMQLDPNAVHPFNQLVSDLRRQEQ